METRVVARLAVRQTLSYRVPWCLAVRRLLSDLVFSDLHREGKGSDVFSYQQRLLTTSLPRLTIDMDMSQSGTQSGTDIGTSEIRSSIPSYPSTFELPRVALIFSAAPAPFPLTPPIPLVLSDGPLSCAN